MSDEQPILLKWQHLLANCGKAIVTYVNVTPYKYEYRNCGLFTNCPFYNLCLSKQKTEKKEGKNE